MNRTAEVSELFFGEQRRLVESFQAYEPGQGFRLSKWRRDHLGGGVCRILEQGEVFERGGVNVSIVHGEQTPPAIAQSRADAKGRPFSATGISLVLHPRNPYAPSFHANFRFFEIDGGAWWFGGGCDLTPSYGFDEDAIHFHRTLKQWCDRYDPARYPEWKRDCDRYFSLPHRDEMRGIGGVFFDDITDGEPGGFDRCWTLVTDGLAALLPAYLPILDRRSQMTYSGRQRDWQLARRGRYVEFNLVYDRGTTFGLQTRGNVEAILMSMPPLARWGFEITPEPGSPEADVSRFLRPHDWAGSSPEVGPPQLGGQGFVALSGAGR